MTLSFEQGPIRPPSEAGSLLIRVSRNCPWNRCAFCRTYKGDNFELRSVGEITQEIDNIAAIAGHLRELSLREGEGGLISERILRMVFDPYSHLDEYRRTVAVWLHYGGETVFLQDADSLVMKTADIAALLGHIHAVLPSVKRITTYCRSKTAARKSVGELRQLREAGLSRIHVGIESGLDPLLAKIQKGATAADHIEGGQKIKAAGISLCGYVMPGLGGRWYSLDHARETARVVNAIDPDFIRLRTLQVVHGTPLMEMMKAGEFAPLGDEEILREIREFILALTGIGTTLVSDHILNLLEEVEGKLPGDRQKMLDVLDRYFSLTAEQRLVFRLGRRQGIYRRLDDLAERGTFGELKSIVDHYQALGNGALENHLAAIMGRYI
jgi:hypothetical protein